MTTMNRSAKVEILEAEIAAVKAQNDRLTEENVFLRDKLQRLATNTRSTAATNVEAKLKAFQMEDERDQIFQNLENLKKRYNKLHEAFCEKVKRCKILESTFEQQKTLPGLVMKSTLKQRNEGNSIQSMNQTKTLIEEKEKACALQTASLESKLIQLKNELDEAYDIIDALEFELETVDLLEEENQRLRQELSKLKSKYEEIKKSPNAKTSQTSEGGPPSYDHLVDTECSHRSTESICEECSKSSDLDSHALERSVLTNSVLENVGVESNMLRRELLKSRLQNAIKFKQNPM